MANPPSDFALSVDQKQRILEARARIPQLEKEIAKMRRALIDTSGLEDQLANLKKQVNAIHDTYIKPPSQ